MGPTVDGSILGVFFKSGTPAVTVAATATITPDTPKPKADRLVFVIHKPF